MPAFFMTLPAIHPLIVHFPIALAMTAFFFQILGIFKSDEKFLKTAWYLLLCVAVVMPLAALTGWFEVERIKLRHPILDAHRLAGFIALGLAWIAVATGYFLRQSNKQKFVLLILLFLLALSVGIAGFYGGKMVYEYGVGVAS